MKHFSNTFDFIQVSYIFMDRLIHKEIDLNDINEIAFIKQVSLEQ